MDPFPAYFCPEFYCSSPVFVDFETVNWENRKAGSFRLEGVVEQWPGFVQLVWGWYAPSCCCYAIVYMNTNQALWIWFQEFGVMSYWWRDGHPQQDNHLRNRFQTASLTVQTITGLCVISLKTVWIKLCEWDICPVLRRHHWGTPSSL